MFRSTLLSATKTTVRGVRYNSTAAKATAAASGIVNKASGKFFFLLCFAHILLSLSTNLLDDASQAFAC